jgi:hypothetical protein
VEKKVRIFRNFAAADEQNARDDRALRPEDRIRIVLEFRNRVYPDAVHQGIQRVCRIVKLEKS